MDTGYFTILALLGLGVLYGLRTNKSQEKNTSSSALSGLGLFIVSFAGIFAAYRFGGDRIGFLVGLAVTAILTAMVFVYIGKVFGSAFQKRSDGDEPSEWDKVRRGSKVGNAFAAFFGILFVLVLLILGIRNL